MTKITWTNETWNPVAGCTKIADGCQNCYAEKMAIRLKGIAENDLRKKTIQVYRNVISDIDLRQGWNGNVLCREDVIDIPLHWRKPRKIFVCSMSDLFHPKVPFEFIDKVFQTIALCWGNSSYRRNSYPNHTFQILTKRPERMAKYMSGDVKKRWGDGAPLVGPLSNLWIGTSISTDTDAERNIPILLKIPAAVRFVSIEPILERIDLSQRYLGQIHQCIIGCESGPKRRPCKPEWIEDAVRQCVEANVSVFIKQIEINGKVSKNPKEWPEWAQRQEYPRKQE